MKTSSHTSLPKGFTLIELLVVIAIIAVLASAGFAVGPAMMNRAKKVSGQATATAIVNAVEQFYTEYSALPATSDSPSETKLDTKDSAMLKILAGEDTNGQNPRKIRFLSVKEAKNGIDGAVYSGNSLSEILDPWGKPYYLWLDYNYDEYLEFTPEGNSQVKLRGRRVAVYSLGVKNNETPTAKSLVKTW